MPKGRPRKEKPRAEPPRAKPGAGARGAWLSCGEEPAAVLPPAEKDKSSPVGSWLMGPGQGSPLPARCTPPPAPPTPCLRTPASAATNPLLPPATGRAAQREGKYGRASCHPAEERRSAPWRQEEGSRPSRLGWKTRSLRDDLRHSYNNVNRN